MRHRVTNATSYLLSLLIAAFLLSFGPAAAQANDASLNPPDSPDHVGSADKEGSLADPILNANAQLKARKATSWRDNGQRWVLLEQDVSFSVGNYAFRANRAVVRIGPQPMPGHVVHHIAVYFENARTLRGRQRIEAEAQRLLVTARTRGQVLLSTDLLNDATAAPDDSFVGDGVARVQKYLADLAEGTEKLEPGGKLFGPTVDDERLARRREIEQQLRKFKPGKRPQPQPEPQPTPEPPPQPEPRTPIDPQPQEPIEPTGPKGVTEPVLAIDMADQEILPATGVLYFQRVSQITLEQLANQTWTVTLMGKVRIIYQDLQHGRAMTLTAENAVIFLDPAHDGDLSAATSLSAENVLGIYLEENVVVSDGFFTIRAPRVYIDPKRNKAILLEAVVYAYDVKQKLPLFLRADMLRQEARTTFSGENVTLTTSDFAEPHFSIAAQKLTFTQETDTQGQLRQRYTASDNVFKIGGLPVGYWPFLAGEVSQVPLERVSIGMRNESDNNLEPDIRTRWNLFALAGHDAPDGVGLTGDLDYRGDHGLAVGTNLDYDLPGMYGAFQGYLLPYDTGKDDIGDREKVDFDGQIRGFGQWQHRQYLEHNLELSLELAYVSGETFLERFFRHEAVTAKTYETSVYLKQQEQERAVTFLTRYNLNDFLAQTTAYQAPGYFIDKVPEFGYYRVGTSLFENRLSYYTENRLTRMRIRGGDDSPSDRGLTTPNSLLLLGIPATTTFQNALDAAGVPSDWRLRFDSRHEIQMPVRLGTIDMVPYVAGRFTGYDEDFEDFAGEDSNYRLWGTVGSRFHTQFHKNYDQIESRLLDLHRLRHIIEPHVDVFAMGSTIDPDHLPIYDQIVEGIQDGAGTRIGMRNILQTQRGSPDRRHNADWIVTNTDLVLRSSEVDVDTEFARYFGYRPEYSVGGNHVYQDLRWLLSDTFALVGDVTYNIEDYLMPYWRIGTTLQQTPRLTWFANYTEVHALSSQLVNYGFRYKLTRTYRMNFRHGISFNESQTRDLTVSLERKLPQLSVLVIARHDDIDDEQSVGVSLIPKGLQVGPVDPTTGALIP